MRRAREEQAKSIPLSFPILFMIHEFFSSLLFYFYTSMNSWCFILAWIHDVVGNGPFFPSFLLSFFPPPSFPLSFFPPSFLGKWEEHAKSKGRACKEQGKGREGKSKGREGKGGLLLLMSRSSPPYFIREIPCPSLGTTSGKETEVGRQRNPTPPSLKLFLSITMKSFYGNK